MKQFPYFIAFVAINISFLWNGLIAQDIKKDAHPGKFYTVEKSYENSNVDGYNLYIPNSCTNDSKAFPIIIFLQGGLGVGGRVDAIFNWELPKELKETRELGSELKELKLNTFIYVMPHISSGQYYENADAIKEIISEVSKNYNVDEHRIYLTGLSKGGHGTWGVASKMTEIFAAIAPICGAAYGIVDYRNLTKIPILTAHNIFDHRVDYNQTKGIVLKIEEISGKKFSQSKTISEVDYGNNDLIFISGEGEQKGHDAWTEVYNNVNFYKWLLRFRKE
jgi:predicted peptidase